MSNWNDLYQRWVMLRALSDAAFAFGPPAVASDAHKLLQAKMEGKYGRLNAASITPEDQKRLRDSMKASDRACDEAYELYGMPAERAAIELVRCPAPDAEAVRIKYDAIINHELDNHTGMEGDDAFEMIRADVERLQGAA